MTDTSTVNAVTSIRAAESAVEVRRLGTVDYRVAWQLQRDVADARIAGRESVARRTFWSVNPAMPGQRVGEIAAAQASDVASAVAAAVRDAAGGRHR